jgi:hypothetical protein
VARANGGRGGGSQTRWLDVNGKVTDDITKSVTGEIYSHTKGDWQRLSKAKLAEAVKAVIENTPGAWFLLYKIKILIFLCIKN